MLLQMRVGVWFLRGGSVAIIIIYNSHLMVFNIFWHTRSFGSVYFKFYLNYFFDTTKTNNYFVFRFGSVTNDKSFVNMLAVFPFAVNILFYLYYRYIYMQITIL